LAASALNGKKKTIPKNILKDILNCNFVFRILI